jgi:hypothetical protein
MPVLKLLLNKILKIKNETQVTLYNFCSSIIAGSRKFKSASDSRLAVAETSETIDSDGDAVPPVVLLQALMEEEMLRVERADDDCPGGLFNGNRRDIMPVIVGIAREYSDKDWISCQ